MAEAVEPAAQQVLVTDSPDDRPPLVRAMEWASRITTIAATMVVPIVAGYWLDQRFGTRVVFVALGGIAGLAIGLWSLIQIAQQPPRGDEKNRHDHEHE